MNNAAKTLEEIENDYWGAPPTGSRLVTRVHRLRKVPIGKFNVEDLRIMIGQDFGTVHLLPFAMKALDDDPMVAGDFYEGDLLAVVLRSKIVNELNDPDVRRRLIGYCHKAVESLVSNSDEDSDDTFYGGSPEDYGLQPRDFERIKIERLAEEMNGSPWEEIKAFMERAA